MQKLILRNFQSPGDIVMLTAAVRDLHRGYADQFLTDVRTSSPQLWENNPYTTALSEHDPEVKIMDCHYPLIHRSNQLPYHFIHGFVHFLNEKMGLNIQPTAFKGDIHLSEMEKASLCEVHETIGYDEPFWLVAAGGKQDFTIKWWDTQRFQKVIDHFSGTLKFVQVGAQGHYHPELHGVIDLRGKTDLRQLIQVVFHSQGVLTPVSLLMHLAAAVPSRELLTGRMDSKVESLPIRPCVVIAGGREAPHWEAYPTHQFIHTVGALPCCKTGGCWRSRTLPLGDRSDKDQPEHLCLDVVDKLPHCMDMITSDEVIRRIEMYLASAKAEPASPEVMNKIELVSPEKLWVLGDEPLTLETARSRTEKFIAQIQPFPGTFEGRGVVICGGGIGYFTCAWVCVNMLRRLGCSIPVQLWYLGEREMDDRMKSLIGRLDVECVDAVAMKQQFAARRLNGWELKPYSILHSPFQEVLYLDADNVPVVNPAFLFDTPQFKDTGAVFWPDFGRLKPSRLIWHICGAAYRDEPEFESGQIVVNKERCWKALLLAMWYNEYSDFYYQYVHGDKETFHMAFRRLEQPFAMPPTPVHALHGTMCQHDFDGRRVFQHRNGDKWTLSGQNKNVTDFWFEKECKEYLRELDRLWYGQRLQVPRFFDPKKSKELQATAKELTRVTFDYRRVGFDNRTMRFLPDGRIGEGTGSCETFWDLVQENGDTVLVVSSEHQATCRLKREKTGIWKGRWLRHEKMAVELTPLTRFRMKKERFRQIQAMTKPLRLTESILFRAPLTGYTGYGLHAAQIVTDLQSMGYNVDIRAIVIEEAFAPIPTNVRHSIVCEEPKASWELLLHPPGHSLSPDRKTVYFTMWESTRLHPSSVKILNQAECVIVPSKWNASCFSASGVDRPIRIVPLGISTEVFRYLPMNMEGPCIFGAAGRLESGGARKGINEVIKLFKRAFPKEKDVRLKIKVFPDCKVLRVSDPRIEIRREYLAERELSDWFRGITCFVSAARGEGWGLMQHQALATGRPLISINFGGVTEFFTEEMGYPVNFHLVPSVGLYSGCGLWAEPDAGHMIDLMRHVYRNRDEARAHGKKAAISTGKYTWRKSSEALVQALKEIGMLA